MSFDIKRVEMKRSLAMQRLMESIIIFKNFLVTLDRIVTISIDR